MRSAWRLAGPNHTPFARLHGTAYCDVTGAKNIPTILYHALYAREHIKGDFAYYHESDVFPHTRFFMPAVKMRALESVVFSNGFDGAINHIFNYCDPIYILIK